MLPPGHVAVGYLAYSALRRAIHGDVPPASAIPWLLLGTQLPDLIDKPLAWWFGVLPAGRSLAHSLLFAVPLLLLARRWFRRSDRPGAGEGLAVGYLSHLLVDAAPLLWSRPELASFLVWPVLPAQVRPRPAIWPPQVLFSPTELAFGLVIALVWIADGTPGLEYARWMRGRLIDR
ncbi:metal-dependent hydrolase [Halosolutus amylolyticus]|uniref:Metal-dependent hydrolase n=1 Tax=Halosolutus amylolyticus TaxID=2932267 RepID=A0ABD5PP50_9EURY|nr:metal-dependent hydrolase [Halosolutus amylolyticus]